MSDSVFLDTNILVYAWDSSAPTKQAVAQRAIERGITEGSASISVQCLSEFFVTVTRKIPRPIAADIALEIVDRLSLLQVVELDATLVREAIVLHSEQQVSYWDAMIIVAANRGGCETILSEDLQSGRRYGSVTIRNPFL